MNNPITDFFRRHAAVPATDAGPTWSQADEATLLDWFNRLAPIVQRGWNARERRDATATERRGCTGIYQEVAAEVARRANLSAPSPEIMGAYFRSLLPQR